MHQISVSVIYVSSVMFRPTNSELQNNIRLQRAEKTKTEFHEMKPNSSKDGAMHEGDNPLFWNDFIFFNSLMYIFILSKYWCDVLSSGLLRASDT
jgi:hypothetical protein